MALFPNNLTKEIDKGFSSLGGKVVALNNVVLLAIRLSFSVTANETLGVWDSDDLLPATSFPRPGDPCDLASPLSISPSTSAHPT